MTHNEHRLGVSEINLVNRHLPLITPVDSQKMADAIEEIDQLYGLDHVALAEKSGMLDFAYDASRLCIQCVEDILDKYEIQIKQGWWTHIKEEYYRFVDQNIKDAAQHEPWSCHNTPVHTRK